MHKSLTRSVGPIRPTNVIKAGEPVAEWPPIERSPHCLLPPYDQVRPPFTTPDDRELRAALYEAVGDIQLGAYDRAFLDYPWDVSTTAALVSLFNRVRGASRRL